MTESTAIQAATAEVQARIRASFERQGLMRHLGACLGDIGHGLVRIKLSASPEMSQQHGYVHAGATATIADSAGATQPSR
jgi:acyl-coenzyme A thioesterase PaaI-like protein